MNALHTVPADPVWRRAAPGVLVLIGAVLLYRDTAQAMVHIWNTSETYTHAYLVLPIVVWLAWRRRAVLAVQPTSPEPWLLVPLALAALLWLLGELSAANALTQFAFVLLLVLVVPAVFGLKLARALLFPLAFMFFAVPVGDFLVPQMMDWTADFTVAALQLTGIPVYREGLQFIVPTGAWSVVSACSGVRYLIASFMVGTLFAYLNYQTVRKRAIFVALSLLVPLVANWFRAYMIVMLGHLSNNKLAAGVDHLIYGWVFFGLVIGLMFWIGARWVDPYEDAATPSPGYPATTGGASAGAGFSPWVVAALALMLMGIAQATFWHLSRASTATTPSVKLPDRLAQDWVATPTALADWVPSFKNAKAVAARSYVQGGRKAAVWMAYYRDQTYETKLLTSSNVLTEVGLESGWVSTAKGTRRVSASDVDRTFLQADLRAPMHLDNAARQSLRAWQVYWIGGHFIASESRARLQLALNRLMGQGDDAAVVIFYTDIAEGADSGVADRTLENFAADSLPAVRAQLEEARRLR